MKRAILYWSFLSTLFLVLITGCNSNSFIIKDDAFQATYQENCKVDVQIQASGNSFRVSGQGEFHNGEMVWLCYGAKHTWIGLVTYSGFSFSSDSNAPLQFKLDKKGYVYLSGTGTITFPDGTVVNLPE